MPQRTGIRKTVPQKLIELFEASLPKDYFKEYYEGDPIIPRNFPCLIVSEPVTSEDTGATGFDEITHEILIQVVFNKKDEIGKPANEATVDNEIDYIVQGRDETTGEYLPQTIKGVLRTNFTLSGLAVENVSRLRKGVIPRSEQLMTAEGHIECTITELQQVTRS